MLFTGEAWVKTEPIENNAKIKKIDVLKIFQAVPHLALSHLSLDWVGFLVLFRQTRDVIITKSWSLSMSAPGKIALSHRCNLQQS